MRKAIIILQLLLATTIVQGSEAPLLAEADTLQVESESRLNRFELRRVERNIKRRKYIFAGEIFAGVTASYSSLSGSNADFLVLLNDIDASGSIGSIKPYVGYFYRDNRAVGARFGYTSSQGTVDSTTVDLGDVNDNLSFSVPYLSLRSKSYNYSIFHRAYAPIDNTGHIGLFAELELYAKSGRNIFEYENGTAISSVESRSRSVGLSFNPGISAFVLNNVCATLSFQFGGVDFTSIDQFNEAGELIGHRESSQMSFTFNLFAINFGITVHIW